MPAEGWYVDGEPFETLGGTVIEDQSGWFDTPGQRGDDDVLAGQHGERFKPKKLGAGRIPMNVAVHGCNSDWSVPSAGSEQRALFERNLESFLRRVVKSHRQLLVERVHATRNGSTPRRQAYCQVINEITPAMAGYTYGLVPFEWKVTGAYWSDVDPTSQRLAYDVTGGSAQDIESFALAGQTGYCSDAVVTVTGPCTTVGVKDTETGKGWTYAGGLSSGQTLVVDSGAFTAVKGVSTDVLVDLVFDGPNLLEIVPAPSEVRGPDLTVTATGASGAFDVTAVTRRKWLTP